MGLAFASALVVLLGSGVAISRLGSDGRSNADGGTVAAPSVPSPTGAEGDAATGGSGIDEVPPAEAGSAPAQAAPRRTSAPVRNGVRSGAATTAPAAAPAAADAAGADTASSGSGNGSSGPSEPAAPSAGDGSSGPPQSAPPAPLVSASVSAGQGANGAVVGAGVGDSPETDVTVGSNQVVGDAPPSSGTAIGLGGTLLHPPPTIPTPPG